MLLVLHCSFFFLFFFFLFVYLQLTFLTEGKLGPKGSPEISKKSGKINPEINLFSHRLLDGLLMDFGSILSLFFNEFSCFFHCLFEAVFLMNFNSFLDRSLNCVNPKIIDFSLVLIGYSALGTFRRRSLFS